MITNSLGLPQAIVDAVKNDPYTRGKSDISVTQLISPPHQRLLRQHNEIVEDVADRIWSLVGQVGHGIVERAYPQAFKDDVQNLSALESYQRYGLVVEKRFFTEVNGWTVSGQVDVIEGDTLTDYKFTTVYSVMGEHKQEWEQQLNLLRALAIRAGITSIQKLRICAVLRDWSKGKRLNEGYPKRQVEMVEIPVWSDEQAEAFLLDRVQAHQSENPPICSDFERWKKDDVFAVMKKGNKRAIKLHESMQSASAHAEELGGAYIVEHRPGEYKRCMEYCNVSHVCPAFKVDLEQGHE